MDFSNDLLRQPSLFKYALLQLIELSRIGQRFTRFDQSGCSTKQYVNEFCTVRAGTARRSGHTYAATNLMADTFNHAIYITSTLDQNKIAKKMYLDFHTHSNPEDHQWGIVSNIKTCMDYFRGLPPIYEAIIFDTSFAMRNTDKEKWLDFLVGWRTGRKNEPSFVIYLQ